MLALVEGCHLACALPNGRAAAYDRRASCSFRGKARGRPKLSPLTAVGTKKRSATRSAFLARAQIARAAAMPLPVTRLAHVGVFRRCFRRVAGRLGSRQR